MQILSFCRFQVFLLLPRSKNKFGIKTTEEHYKQIQNECEDFVSHDVEVTSEKILKNLDVTETSRVD